MAVADVIDAQVAANARRRNAYVAGLLTRRGLTGLTLVIAVFGAGLLLPAFMHLNPLLQGQHALTGVSWQHPLGTDEVGRDIFARVVFGIRTDMYLVLVAVPISAIVGTAVGMLSAVNAVLGGAFQRLFDVLLGFPGIVMGVAVGIAMTPTQSSIAVTIVLCTIPGFGRQARLVTLAQASRDYVSAAKVLGTSRVRIVVRHILPNIADSAVVRVAVAVAQAVEIEGGLSVIGLGIQPAPSLGSMVSSGSSYLSTRPLYTLAPIAVIFLIVFGCTLIADALNESVQRR